MQTLLPYETVSNYIHLGVYVPVTKEGNIVVDGILAYCYASSDHDMAHFAMAPIQWFPEMIHWIFGKDDGSPAYVNTVKNLGQLAQLLQMKN